MDNQDGQDLLDRQQPGLLLVGHGTRDRRGVSEFLELANLVDQQLPQVAVRPGFLELAEPTIADAVGGLLASGVDSLVVVPVLLFAAGHAKRDIPAAIAEALAGAQIPAVQAPHLGIDPRLIALSAERYQHATAPLATLPADDSMLLMVGRGSRDAVATEEMLAFAELRKRRCGLQHVTTAFYAMADPRLEVAMDVLRQGPFRRIVVQPHLLFSGQIHDQIAQLVAEANRQASHQEWVICQPLGPSSSLAATLVERFMQTLTRQRS